MCSKRRQNPSLLPVLLLTIFLFNAPFSFGQEDTTKAAPAGGGADPAVIAQGETLFKGNCTTCHAINEVVIGPALRNVHERVPSFEWAVSFIRNSQQVIASGDDYAVKLYEEYNKTQMTAFAFSDEEIASIWEYLKAESAKPVVEPVIGGGGDGTVVAQPSVPTEYLTAIMVGLVIVLVFILIVLMLIVSVLTRYLNQRKDLDEEDQAQVNQSFKLGSVIRSDMFIGLASFFFVAILFKSAIDGLFSVGVQQGYAPRQPIAFSHKIHAGQYEIDCQYCHTGVRKSKSANIPSANICMNCHGEIKKDSKEIQKIYTAVEKNRPIEWVRVHNLPDLAYFNHSQHVAVGGLECQTCHGPIEEMEVVAQYSKLTMGWCINCHRETKLNTQGNAYYDKLVQMHEEKNGKNAVLTVEDNGGLECAKCHY